MRFTGKEPVDGAGALVLLGGVTDLWVARGKRVLHFDLTHARPPDEEILALILGRSGTLRAPAFRTGSAFVVGYNPDILAATLL